MLSAVAARKAAQVAMLATSPQNSSKPSSNSPIANAKTERSKGTLKRQNSKRKPSSSSEARRTKKSKQTPKDLSHARYFDGQSSGSPREADVITVDNGEESDSSSASGSSLGDGAYGEDDRPSRSSRASGKPKRAWSPSQPPLDSSDEEASDEEASELDFADSFMEGVIAPKPSRPLDNGYQSQALTFRPEPGRNVFTLFGEKRGILAGRSGCIVALRQGETLALHGVYSITVISGSIAVMGSNLTASSSTTYPVFAPKCSPLPVLQGLQNNAPSSNDIPEKIISQLDSKSSVIFLEDLATGVEGLGMICRTFEGTFGRGDAGNDVLGLATARLMTSINRSLQAFEVLDTWENAFQALIEPITLVGESLQTPVVLVRGPKRTGKSTLARTLMNRVLSRYRRVAFLECDIGQTEFTPPGQVSLNVLDRPVFGPPFTHPYIPYASHFVGSTSPRNSPSHYLSSIRALVQTFKLDLQYSVLDENDVDNGSDQRISEAIPLIINTMGWTKGLGADLARQVEEIIEPTHVFSLQAPLSDRDASQTLPQFGSPARVFEVRGFPATTQSARYSAADWRTMSLLSYFHSIPSPAQYSLLPDGYQPLEPQLIPEAGRVPLCTWNTSLPLTARPPYAVSPATALDSVVLIGPGSEDVVSSEIGRVLNGAVVALVSRQPGYGDEPAAAHDRGLPYVQGTDPPDPSISSCIGLALVRAVSSSLISPSTPSSESQDEENLLHVITPIPPALLISSASRCLVKGEIELPVWGMLDFRDFDRDTARKREKGADWDSTPFLQWSRSNVPGADRRRVRRNLMRKAQM